MKIGISGKVVFEECLGLTSQETVVVVVDERTREIGQAFHEHAKTHAAESVLVEMRERENNGMEPPKAIAALMREADVLILATSKSLSHTAARQEANKRGARVASMPGVTKEMVERTLSGSYEQIHILGDSFKKLLDAGKQVHLSSPAGTDLTFSIEGRMAANDDGIIRTAGSFGNLPAGEAYVAPIEGSANGMLVIDASMAGIGRLEGPLHIRIRDGQAVETEGFGAKWLENIFTLYGDNARNVAELGIGTNPYAIITGAVLEDEKVAGTVHVALGDNSTIGGVVKAESHLDGIITRPTLIIDGTVVIKDGEPVFSK
jgi:leucyl aminopeptidase (aminopeptidase T)